MSSRRFDEMDRMFDQMDRLFDQMRSRLSQSDLGAPFADIAWARGIAVDVYDEEDAVMVLADIPGYEQDEIDVTIRGNVIEIRAEHEDDSEDGYRSRSASERVTLSTEVDEDKATATYHNGVLEICLPYESGRETAHHIDIE